MSSVESITPTAVVRRVFERLSDRDAAALRPFGPMTRAAMIVESIVPTRCKRITR